MEPPSSRSAVHTAAERRAPLVGVVGPCGSGKSTLIAKLETMGYLCRHIAQEHSYVPSMWQKIAKPDVLIYLAASFPVSTARRQLNWEKKDHDEQLRRLAHARAHASIFVDTDELTPDQVLQKVLDYLKKVKV
jgi:RNase adaptor protein for sRNA GlmZ degradation